MGFKVTVEKEFKGQNIADLVVTALEGGSNYWVDKVDFGNTGRKGHERYSDGAIYDGEFRFTVTDRDGETHRFCQESVQNGLNLLYASDVGGHKASARRILDGDYDAWDADVFFQFCVLGEVVYG